MKEFYDHVSELPLLNPIFDWYRTNVDKVHIECIDDEVRIYKAEDEDDSPEDFIRGIPGPNALDDLIDQALGNEN